MFEIYEGNWENFIKKASRIEKKCIRYGNEFSFARCGEVFRQVRLEDGTKMTLKFIQVEITGKAIVNDWEYIATIQHLVSGNVITTYFDVDIPEKYRTAPPVCEHCNIKRARNETCLIRNTKTGEIKQVGKSCLKDFTCGLDSELVAAYESFIHEAEKASEFSGLGNYNNYWSLEDFITCAIAVTNRLGYVKQGAEGVSTKIDCINLYAEDYGNGSNKYARERIEYLNLKADTEDNHKLAKDIISWATTADTNNNSYLENLQILCKEEYISNRNLGIVCSVVTAYKKAKELIAKKEAEKKACAESEYVGNIGDKVEFDVVAGDVVYSTYTDYGMLYIYKFLDANKNVYIWKSSKELEGDINKIKGTIKNHEEYNGVKQTILTRCRVK